MILNIDTGTGYSAGIHSQKKKPTYTHDELFFKVCKHYKQGFNCTVRTSLMNDNIETGTGHPSCFVGYKNLFPYSNSSLKSPLSLIV